MQKALTDAFCRTTEPPSAGRSEWSDLRCQGLEFRVTAADVRSWTFRYRHPVNRKTLRLTIGGYPDIGLSAARRKADELRSKVASGVDPIEAKREEQRASTTKTFGALSDRYMAEHARRHKRQRSADEDERNLKKHVLPKWQSRDFRKIRRADVIELLEGIVTAGSPIAANRVQALISKVFTFAMDNLGLEANPAARIQKRSAENVGRRVLTDNELRLFWNGIVLPPVSRRVGLALRFALLTGARANEVAGINREEFQETVAAGKSWLLPGERSKNKRPHLVPLSKAASLIVDAAEQLIAEGDAFLFPSPTKEKTPITAHALTVAMARFCEKQTGKDGPAKSLREQPPSPHDLRRTFSTRLAAIGIPKEDRDACMNHTPADVGKRHYDLYERAKEKRAALELFAESISEIVANKPKNRHG